MTCPDCLRLLAELDALAPRWSPVLSLVVEIATVSEANARDHHHTRAGRARRQHGAVLAVLRGLSPSGADLLAQHGRLHVRLTRLAAGTLDTDNLAGAMKACRDAVAGWLGTGDAPSSPVTWEVAQEPHRRHRLRPGVRIEVSRPDPRRVIGLFAEGP